MSGHMFCKMLSKPKEKTQKMFGGMPAGRLNEKFEETAGVHLELVRGNARDDARKTFRASVQNICFGNRQKTCSKICNVELFSASRQTTTTRSSAPQPTLTTRQPRTCEPPDGFQRVQRTGNGCSQYTPAPRRPPRQTNDSPVHPRTDTPH